VQAISASGDAASLLVLIVEDDPESAVELEGIVQAAGYRTRLASDGSEALRLLHESPDAAIVITDLRMPKMDGLSFVAAYRKQFGTLNGAQIIFVSGNAGLSDAVSALRLEAVDFLVKPLSRAGVFEALRKASSAYLSRGGAATQNFVILRQAEAVASHALKLANDFASLVSGTARPRAALFKPRNPALSQVPSSEGAAPRSLPYEAPLESGDPEVEHVKRRLRALIKLRQMRTAHFQGDLFSDPCWDMLLDLMEARLNEKQISVSSLCIASGVPQTTALRRIEDLIAAELVSREDDPADRRRVFVCLTEECATRFGRYLDDISQLF
jgi:CheY-like chemotaxis protein/DNA-binding MarR family transcriptional regulator